MINICQILRTVVYCTPDAWHCAFQRTQKHTRTHTHTRARTRMSHTHILLGSVYIDTSLRVAGMNGEGVNSGAVIAVKTHDFKLEGWRKRLVGIFKKNDQLFLDCQYT